MKKFIKLFLILLPLVLLSLVIVTGCTPNEENNKPYYTIEYLTDGNGTIKGNQTQTVAYGENSTPVRAIAKEGYCFVSWSDGVTTAERTDLNVSADINVTARFEKQKFTVKYLTDGNGYIQGESEQSVAYGESSAIVMAIANEGYNFVQWSDGVETIERQDNNISANRTYTAIFEKKTFTVRYECKSGMLIITTESGKAYAGPFVDFDVKYGEDCEKIVSIETMSPNLIFVGWANGIETVERQELSVTSDIIIKAKFGYELTYKVEGEKGGQIVGNCRQFN